MKKKERDEYVGRSVGPGALTFHYGEPVFSKWNVHTFTYVPKSRRNVDISYFVKTRSYTF